MISRKFWAVTACMVALSGPACAQPQGNNQQSNNQQQNANSEQAKPETPKPDIGIASVQSKAAEQSAVQTEVYEPDCRKPKNQPDADLCVQRRVADAAENTLQLTRIQTYAGIVGLVAVLVTLGVTAYTGKAASMAAQAAIDTVGTERAWLSFRDLTFAYANNPRIDGIEYAEAMMIAINWINSGRSPAVRSNILIAYEMINLNDNIPTKKPDNTPALGIIGPNNVATSNYVTIFGNDLSDFRRGNRKLIIWSRAVYGSIYFGEKMFHTEACLELTANGEVVNRDGTTSPNIDIRMVGDFNTAS